MENNNPSEILYMPGQTTEEVLRLQKQAQLLNPMTRRMLETAGITSDMRILDIGCGSPGSSDAL